MKVVLIVLSLMLSSASFGQSKAEMAQMLKQFKANGMFSEEQLKAAEAQLNKMSDDDLNKLKAQAAQKMNDPEVQKKLQEMKNKQQN